MLRQENTIQVVPLADMSDNPRDHIVGSEGERLLIGQNKDTCTE